MKFLSLTFIFLFGYFNISVAQWQTVQTPSVSRLRDICVVDRNIIWAAGDSSIIRSTDGGSTWMHFYDVLPAGNYQFMCAASANHVWLNTFRSNASRIFASTNGGASWQEQFINPATYIDKIHFFDQNTGILIADPVSGQTTGFFITRNGGLNWYKSPASPYADILVEGCMGCLDTSLVWFVGVFQNRDRLFKLSGGLDNNWQRYDFLDYIHMNKALFKDANTALATNGSVVLKSTNGGQNWFIHNNQALNGYLPKNFILVPNTDIVILSNTNNIRLSYDLCVTWQQLYGYGSGSYFNYGDSYDSTSTFLAGSGGRVYRYDRDYIGIKKLSEAIPEEFGLSQNYPNPFNPITNFELRISNFGFVTLRIYDISGMEVAVLLNENMSPGVYKIRFNGAELASGVYFCEIAAGQFRETRKMILLK